VEEFLTIKFNSKIQCFGAPCTYVDMFKVENFKSKKLIQDLRNQVTLIKNDEDFIRPFLDQRNNYKKSHSDFLIFKNTSILFVRL
jgi:hypothetical protein